MTSPILCDLTEGIFQITLNQPERRNTLSIEMLDALNQALDSLVSEPSTRVVLLTANGSTFSAGMDLKRVPLGDPGAAKDFAYSLADTYRSLLRLPRPYLCAVDGPAMGGAVGLALAADLIWAGPNAKFAFPETKIGLAPALVSVVARRRLIPGNLAAMAVSGMSVSGSDLLRLGLADRMAAESAAVEAEAFARQLIRENSGEAMRRTKAFLAARDLADLDSELARAIREFREAVATPSAQTGIAAFQEKRTLDWTETLEVND
jgi:enoyl-CoA hydratase/carnithine racemase